MEAPEWINLSDDELLEKKISKLGLTLAGSPVEPLVKQLYDELSQKGLAFHPPCHIGDEWFVPVGIPAIFIPFFLTHERLRKLERKIILEVEGETPEWFLRLMRHEAAHAYAYAFQLYRKKKWQQTFGLTSTEETPQFYRPRPYSRSYVVHLDDWYAQSHPDEDFAETFVIVDAPLLDQPKTKTMAELIEKVGLADRKVLWVFDQIDEKALKSTRNLARVRTSESRTLNTYELMNCDCLVLTEGGLKSLAERVHAAQQVNA